MISKVSRNDMVNAEMIVEGFLPPYESKIVILHSDVINFYKNKCYHDDIVPIVLSDYSPGDGLINWGMLKQDIVSLLVRGATLCFLYDVDLVNNV